MAGSLRSAATAQSPFTTPTERYAGSRNMISSMAARCCLTVHSLRGAGLLVCWVSPLSSVCPVVLLCAASAASCHSDPSILGPILMVLRDAHAAVSLCTVAVAAQRPEWSIPRYRCSAHSALSTFTLAPIRVQWLWTCRTERSNGRSLCVSRECD